MSYMVLLSKQGVLTGKEDHVEGKCAGEFETLEEAEEFSKSLRATDYPDYDTIEIAEAHRVTPIGDNSDWQGLDHKIWD